MLSRARHTSLDCSVDAEEGMTVRRGLRSSVENNTAPCTLTLSTPTLHVFVLTVQAAAGEILSFLCKFILLIS